MENFRSKGHLLLAPSFFVAKGGKLRFPFLLFSIYYFRSLTLAVPSYSFGARNENFSSKSSQPHLSLSRSPTGNISRFAPRNISLRHRRNIASPPVTYRASRKRSIITAARGSAASQVEAQKTTAEFFFSAVVFYCIFAFL